MAASMARVLTLKASCCRRHLTQNIYKPSSALQSLQRLSSTNASNTETDVESTFEDFDEMEEEERIQRLQDISGLSEALKRRLHGQVPEIVNDYQRSVRYHRKLYGKLGAESGIDPRLSWTGRKKALELAKLTREWEPPLEERLEKLRMQKDEWTKKMEMREKKVAENMAKMDQWIADYRQRQVQKDVEAQKKEEKKRKLLEEAREYFGYYVDPRDAKFQEMLEEKEKQEKALAKKQKKEKRLEKLAARLQYMAQEAEKSK